MSETKRTKWNQELLSLGALPLTVRLRSVTVVIITHKAQSLNYNYIKPYFTIHNMCAGHVGARLKKFDHRASV